MSHRLAAILTVCLLTPPALAQTPPHACTFRRGSDTLNEACQTLLAETAQAWKAAKEAGRTPTIGVAGYAQDQQGPRFDGLLSRRRAAAVAEALERLGIDPDRIAVTIPAGEERDLYTRITPHDRRVDIQLRD